MNNLFITTFLVILISFTIFYFTRKPIILVNATEDYIIFTNQYYPKDYDKCKAYSRNCLLGLMDQDGSIIYQANYNKIIIEDRIILLIKDDEIKIVKRENPKEIIKIFEGYTIKKSIDNLFIISKNNQDYQLINEYGEVYPIEDYNFDIYSSSDNGFVRISSGGKLGYLSIEGEQITPIYHKAYPFNEEGYAMVCIDDKCGFINKEGNVVTDLEYYDFKPTSSPSIFISQLGLNGPFGLVSLDNNMILEAKYWNIKELEDQYYIIDEFEVGKFIYHNGVKIHQLKDKYYNKTGNFIHVVNSEDKCGFIEYDGSVVVNPIYEQCININNELFQIKLNNKYGIINKQNEVLIDLNYDVIKYYSDQIIFTKKDDQYSLIDLEGNLVKNLNYEKAVPYEHYIEIEDNSLIGLIDNNGNVVLEPVYEQVKPNKNFIITYLGGYLTAFKYDGSVLVEPIQADNFYVDGPWIIFTKDQILLFQINTHDLFKFSFNKPSELYKLEESYLEVYKDTKEKDTTIVLYHLNGEEIYKENNLNEVLVKNQHVLFTNGKNLYKLNSDGNVELILSAISPRLIDNRNFLIILALINLFIFYINLKSYFAMVDLRRRYYQNWNNKRT